MVPEELAAAIAALPYRFPVKGKVEHLARVVRADEWERAMRGVYPLMHTHVPPLLSRFLEVKARLGSAVERAYYRGMTVEQLVTRLLTKRPLCFFEKKDVYLLRDGTRGMGGFDPIGTEEEEPPHVLAELQSYDEMALSALIGMSTPTHFINDGARHNRGAASAKCEPSGVFVGLVGARFERTGVMEWQHLIVTAEQNTAHNGYGPPPPGAPHDERRALLQAWAALYDKEYLPTFDEAHAALRAQDGRFMSLGRGRLLNIELYRRRLRLSIEPFLVDADERAAASARHAYVHAVGLGLGVWMVDAHQARLMVEVYAQILHERSLPHIAVLDFSWFPPECISCGGVHSGQCWPNTNLRILFSQRNPAAPLPPRPPPLPPYLLVAMYAWDGNSYPGNEYWLGMLDASGDPAAACCSTIDILQNPDLNPTRVHGAAARVMSLDAAISKPLAEACA
ncbi:hypothetical protein AB1Y20_023659 [Prymnesium parvum]|uniref:Uncharacterized protein n=1 Tax=Prymnesium parvum TaxID=97485 RepID=A0AB34JF65_PRYPA